MRTAKSNEDLVIFGMPGTNVQSKESRVVTFDHDESNKAQQHHKSKMISKLDEKESISPFETEMRNHCNYAPQIDSFSISGEFAHHLVVENGNKQPFDI